jgi:hypothetical protein
VGRLGVGLCLVHELTLQLASPPSLYTSNSQRPVSDDLGVHSGEELQLTTTITHVDGPTEIYKLTRKEAQE